MGTDQFGSVGRFNSGLASANAISKAELKQGKISKSYQGDNYVEGDWEIRISDDGKFYNLWRYQLKEDLTGYEWHKVGRFGESIETDNFILKDGSGRLWFLDENSNRRTLIKVASDNRGITSGNTDGIHALITKDDVLKVTPLSELKYFKGLSGIVSQQPVYKTLSYWSNISVSRFPLIIVGSEFFVNNVTADTKVRISVLNITTNQIIAQSCTEYDFLKGNGNAVVDGVNRIDFLEEYPLKDGANIKIEFSFSKDVDILGYDNLDMGAPDDPKFYIDANEKARVLKEEIILTDKNISEKILNGSKAEFYHLYGDEKINIYRHSLEPENVRFGDYRYNTIITSKDKLKINLAGKEERITLGFHSIDQINISNFEYDVKFNKNYNIKSILLDVGDKTSDVANRQVGIEIIDKSTNELIYSNIEDQKKFYFNNGVDPNAWKMVKGLNEYKIYNYVELLKNTDYTFKISFSTVTTKPYIKGKIFSMNNIKPYFEINVVEIKTQSISKTDDLGYSEELHNRHIGLASVHDEEEDMMLAVDDKILSWDDINEEHKQRDNRLGAFEEKILNYVDDNFVKIAASNENGKAFVQDKNTNQLLIVDDEFLEWS